MQKIDARAKRGSMQQWCKGQRHGNAGELVSRREVPSPSRS
jgi:hypothetical protein